MNLIIATSNTEFAKSLKESMKSYEVNVLDIVTCVEDLVETLGAMPNVDAILLKTDLAKKNNDYRLEMLSDVVLSIRQTPQFEKVTFSILSDYQEGHPLLAEFFEIGIYNFFTRNGIAFTVKNLIDSFETPMSFSMALKYRTASKDIPWRRDLSKPQTIQVKFQDGPPRNGVPVREQKQTENEDEKPKSEKIKLPKIPKITSAEKTSSTQAVVDDEWIFEEKVSSLTRTNVVVGTVIIAVTSVQSHLGSTNTAISIAKYLKDAGNDVALVEANNSMDFERMHSLVEGEQVTLKEDYFDLYGVPHLKYREDMDLGDIYTCYQFVVLDLGEITKSPLKNELRRAHFKCVIASSDEWKFHWIEEFLLNVEVEDLIFMVPSSETKETNDLASRLKNYDVFPLESHSNPYLVPDGTKNIYEKLFNNYHKKNGIQVSRKDLLMTALIGACITAVGFLAFLFIK